jgi:cytochrome c oxidase subunit II
LNLVSSGTSGFLRTCAALRGRASRAAASIGASVGLLLLHGYALAQPDRVVDMPGGPRVNQLNLPPGITAVARDQYWLNNFLMILCLVIFVGVFGVMFYSLWAHRRSRGHEAHDFHESTAVEITWTVVPFIIVIGMALPATRLMVEMKDTSAADMTVKVTGYQWRWGYDYLRGEGEGIGFLSTLATPREQIEGRAGRSPTYLMEVDNPLVVPAGKKIRLVITANDVIHSWGVPALGVKQDAIPGFVRDAWFRAETPGIYRGACYELCGRDHAFMPIVVDVRTPEEYSKWATEQHKAMLARMDDPAKEWSIADLMARGEKVYAANCVACHQAGGQGVPPAFPPLAGGKRVLGPPQGVIQVLLNGVPGTAMAPFRQLNDVELAAVGTYIRNAFGNQAEIPVIQPKEFTAARK